jgi:predicted nucleic acid-binding protein
VSGGLYLADKSALSQAATHLEVARVLTGYGRDGLLATCAVIDLEVLYSAKSPAEYTEIAALRAEAFSDLPLVPRIGVLARETRARLAEATQHRAAGVIDLLIAATAEHYGATVLHYDADFDHIAAVTGQAMRWVVPRGSLG